MSIGFAVEKTLYRPSWWYRFGYRFRVGPYRFCSNLHEKPSKSRGFLWKNGASSGWSFCSYRTWSNWTKSWTIRLDKGTKSYPTNPNSHDFFVLLCPSKPPFKHVLDTTLPYTNRLQWKMDLLKMHSLFNMWIFHIGDIQNSYIPYPHYNS